MNQEVTVAKDNRGKPDHPSWGTWSSNSRRVPLLSPECSDLRHEIPSTEKGFLFCFVVVSFFGFVLYFDRKKTDSKKKDIFRNGKKNHWRKTHILCVK